MSVERWIKWWLLVLLAAFLYGEAVHFVFVFAWCAATQGAVKCL